MTYQKRDDRHGAVYAGKFVLKRASHFRIERGKGLVEQENVRPINQGAGQGHALFLPARKRVGVSFAKPLEVECVDQIVHPALVGRSPNSIG